MFCGGVRYADLTGVADCAISPIVPQVTAANASAAVLVRIDVPPS